MIVNRKQVVDNSPYWSDLEDRFIKAKFAGRMKSLPSIIVHTRQEVHNKLTEDRYFFTEIVKDGILLYDADEKPFPSPRPKTPADKLAVAQEYFDEWYPMAGEFYDDYESNLKKHRLSKSAFELHQCVEHLYHTLLSVMTFYSPHSHNIKALRSMVAKIDRRFAYVWPKEFHWQTAAFNILRDAYVKARYSKRGFKITEEQLRWLGGIAQDLSEVVRQVCEERIASWKAAAEQVAEISNTAAQGSAGAKQ